MTDTRTDGGRTLDVLLVEDSPGDIRLTQEAFLFATQAVSLHVVLDGEQALSFLHQDGDHIYAPRPDLILLDLNLPRIDGREVLARIKADATLKTIPTIILTTSMADDDVEKSYELQANSYLNKPVGLEDFEALVASIDDFWLKKARLPASRNAA